MPTANGSYKEFLVTYNLTAQEREKVRNGEPVNTKGKTTITELAKGTFNSGGQLAKMSCNWTEQTIYVTCSDNVHNASNVEQWHQCKAATPPGVYTIVTGGCNTEQPEYIDPGNSGGGSSDGGGGPGGDGSDECTTVANNPGEVGIIDENGCHVGGATQPNDSGNEDSRTPCEVLRDNSADPVFQAKLDSLTNRVTTYNDKHETSITVKKTKNISYKVNATPVNIGFANTMSVKLDLSPYDTAQMHNHVKDYLPIFSYADIVTYYEGYQYLVASRKSIYISYVTSENGTTYAIKINDPSFLDTLFAGLDLDTDQGKYDAKEKIRKIYDEYGQIKPEAFMQAGAEKLFMNVFSDPRMGSGNGIEIYRKDGDVWGKLKWDSAKNVIKENCTFN